MNIKHLVVLAMSASLFLMGCGGDTTTEPQPDNNTANSDSLLTGVVTDTTANTLTVGNIEFVTTDAIFISDGISNANGLSDFGPGTVVTIEGTHSNRHGIAHKIHYDSEVEGVVISANIIAIAATSINDPMTYEGTMNVMGQAIIIDAMTMFKHVDDPTTIVKDNVVEISGMFEEDGAIRAKRVKYKAAALEASEKIEIKGYVNAYDAATGSFMLGECVITTTPNTEFDDIEALHDGMKVEVESIGELVQTDPMCSVEALEIENEDHDGLHDMAKANGMVVGELLGSMFMLQDADNASVNVMIHENTHFVNGTIDNIIDGAILKTIGEYDENGVLMARLINFTDVIIMTERAKGIVISEPDMDGMFELEDRDGAIVTVVINAETKYLPDNATQADIKIDARLMAVGMFDANDNLVASMITIESMEGGAPGTPPMPGLPPVIKYNGNVEAIVLTDAASPELGGQITLLGQTILVTADTQIYKELFGNPIPIPMPIPMPPPITGAPVTPMSSHPEMMLTLADINPEDQVMIMAYFDDAGVLTARVIEVLPALDMPMSIVFGSITEADALANTLVIAGVAIVVTDMTEITPVAKFDMAIIAEAILAGKELKAMVKGTYDAITGKLTAKHIAVHELNIVM